jgi:Reverse transcriptase (RNA-dependent DNA polymerase)/GAG-pre-integrase domain/Integrase core domain
MAKKCGAQQCLIDSATTHSILSDKAYFTQFKPIQANVNTVAGVSKLIEGSGKACVVLPKGTMIKMNDALYSSKTRRNLISFKDLRLCGFHVETTTENKEEYMCLTKNESGKKRVVEKMPAYSSGLYYTYISPIEMNMASNQKVDDPVLYSLWHDRLGHPGTSMILRIIKSSNGHSLKNVKVPLAKELPCKACSLGKLIIRPSKNKIRNENPGFLERIQGDICGPINPSCGPFRYFMVLIDASTRWSHVSLLSTRNTAFAKLLAQIVRLRAQFPDHVIKKIRLDNAGEFTSQSFDDFCMSIGIEVEHPVAHVHTQNGLAEALIKRLQLIARPMLMKSNLPSSAWGHAILHAAALIRLRPTADHESSPLQLVTGKEPSLAHLRTFGCAVYVPIAPPNRTKMGPQRRLGIYVGYESPSIIKYLEPTTGDLFTGRFADCHFNEAEFPTLGGGIMGPPKREISWNTEGIKFLDPPSKVCEQEVLKIIHLQNLANRLPDAFVDSKKVTKSHVPALNAPARVEIPPENPKLNESTARKKRGRPTGAKDQKPRKVRRACDNDIKENEPSNENNDQNSLDAERVNPQPDVEECADASKVEHQNIDNIEISMNYSCTGWLWNREEIEIDEIFAYSVAAEIIDDPDDVEPRSIDECRQRKDWPKWREAIQAELKSLEKREVFGPVVQTPKGVKPVGYKWVFVRKRNEKNEVTRYKGRLVAQGFSQRPGIDYEETYSPVVDATTLRFLVGLTAANGIQMRLMDVVTAYLYGSLDSEIYMKVPEGIKLPKSLQSVNRDLCSIRLMRSLYGLKQSGRMWYKRLCEYLLKEGYKNDPISPCVFIKRTKSGFSIVAVYVDDLNIVGTPDDIENTAKYLMKEFEMKDLGRTKYCLGLQMEHLKDGIFVHQSNYTEKILKRFYMDKAHPLKSPMVVRSLNIKDDPFRPRESNEDVLGSKVPYLSAIGALMYLAVNTRPDIAFAVNLLARFSSEPTKRHWNGVKHIFRYLRGTTDLGLFYKNGTGHVLVGYADLVGFADAGYLSDPTKAKSQTGYVFTYGDTAISWKSTKQTLTATSSNQAELIALYEAGRECVWLRSLINHILGESGLNTLDGSPTTIYEDNTACIAQIKDGYIKGDRTKHVDPKFFSTHDLEKEGKINVQQIRSCDNPADLFTKSLPSTTHHKFTKMIGMRRLRDIQFRGSVI